jgi:hypothetical protein
MDLSRSFVSGTRRVADPIGAGHHHTVGQRHRSKHTLGHTGAQSDPQWRVNAWLNAVGSSAVRDACGRWTVVVVQAETKTRQIGAKSV